MLLFFEYLWHESFTRSVLLSGDLSTDVRSLSSASYPIICRPCLVSLQVSSQGATTDATNEEALQRSVDMASRMAGWAGRVVERVLKEHHRQARPLRFLVVPKKRNNPGESDLGNLCQC